MDSEIGRLVAVIGKRADSAAAAALDTALTRARASEMDGLLPRLSGLMDEAWRGAIAEELARSSSADMAALTAAGEALYGEDREADWDARIVTAVADLWRRHPVGDAPLTVGAIYRLKRGVEGLPAGRLLRLDRATPGYAFRDLLTGAELTYDGPRPEEDLVEVRWTDPPGIG